MKRICLIAVLLLHPPKRSLTRIHRFLPLGEVTIGLSVFIMHSPNAQGLHSLLIVQSFPIVLEPESYYGLCPDSCRFSRTSLRIGLPILIGVSSRSPRVRVLSFPPPTRPIYSWHLRQQGLYFVSQAHPTDT